ncbi:hypothetical protein [Euzebya tangerina]|uniref:hypothetical protein n=1 Tax=Euzebya tangerina TaxID=591198 RepID=UPI000E3184D7|nr:hypothetical protein [Euzebya tangerina]
MDDASVRSRSIMGPVSAAMGPEVLSGGALTASVEQVIDDSDADASALSRELAVAAAAAADHAAAGSQQDAPGCCCVLSRTLVTCSGCA